ncbi:unnamed protein product [Lampetra fluviatilis]
MGGYPGLRRRSSHNARHIGEGRALLTACQTFMAPTPAALSLRIDTERGLRINLPHARGITLSRPTRDERATPRRGEAETWRGAGGAEEGRYRATTPALPTARSSQIVATACEPV